MYNLTMLQNLFSITEIFVQYSTSLFADHDTSDNRRFVLEGLMTASCF